MHLQMILVCFTAALCRCLSSAASVSGSLGVSVLSPVSVQRRLTTILPCWFNVPQKAEGLEVRWYRGDSFDSPIILYRADKTETSQEASYVGRVSFGFKDSASGGIKAGDVSLQLGNVTVEDEGEYTCYVSSDQGYDRGAVSLSVIEMGASPSLSVIWKEGNSVNVSCESAGWHPQPRLHWSDNKQDLASANVMYHKDSSGLVSVHSWILGSGSSDLSCSVGLSDGEKKVARLHLENSTAEPGSPVAGWVAFALLLIGVLAFLGWLFFTHKALFLKKTDHTDGDPSTEPLLKKAVVLQATALNDATKHYVNVTLDKVEKPYLKIVDHKLRENKDAELPTGENPFHLTTIKGTPGFSSGKHYWEVSLRIENTEPKQSWWLGVTSETVFPLQNNGPLTPSNGFWFLSSSKDRANSFQFNTNPKVLLPVLSRPRTVGVYLDYDSGELSFYNVDDQSVIGSLTATFTGEVFPFFNPGRDDQSPMEIIQKKEEDQCNETDKQDVELQVPSCQHH